VRWLGPALLAVLGARLAAAAAAPPPRPPAPDGAGEAPVVDVADLPPLPIGSDQAASAATVRAAEEVSEEVVRGAAKRDQTLGNVASAVTVISGDRLRRFGYRTMAEALRAVAGVYVSDDRLGERVGIRGFQSLGDFNTRVLILIDGVTINEAWAAFAGVGADVAIGVDEIERIEVIRGPVSSVYGTNAFFGIVNVVTRSADGAPRAWARLGAGSLPRESVAAGLALGGGDRQLRAAVTGLVRQGEELTLPALSDQPLRGDDGATVAASVVGSYDGAFGQARIVRRQRAVPFAPYGAEPGPRNYVVDENQVVAEAGYTRALGARVSATGRLYVNAYRFADDYLAAGGAERIQTNGDGTALGAELRGRFVLLDRDRLGLTAGTELSTVDTESRATGTAAIGKTYGLQALYAEVDGAPTRWLSMTAGVRADRNSVLTNRVSPRAALLLSRRDRAGLKLLYAEGFRNASAYESFFEDGVDFVANPDIGPEVIRSVEAVAWARPPGRGVDPAVAVPVAGDRPHQAADRSGVGPAAVRQQRRAAQPRRRGRGQLPRRPRLVWLRRGRAGRGDRGRRRRGRRRRRQRPDPDRQRRRLDPTPGRLGPPVGRGGGGRPACGADAHQRDLRRRRRRAVRPQPAARGARRRPHPRRAQPGRPARGRAGAGGLRPARPHHARARRRGGDRHRAG
jgi:outer membrane receptor protein involved in Fe transport